MISESNLSGLMSTVGPEATYSFLYLAVFNASTTLKYGANSSNTIQGYHLSDFETIAVPIIYLLICVLGLVGNGVVIAALVTLMKRNRKKSVNEILVINLAIADFIFVGCLPFWATQEFLHKRWLFGLVGCKLLSFNTLLNLYASVFFIVAMGIDRCFAVVFCTEAMSHRTPRKAVVACSVIWASAVFVASQALLWRKWRLLGVILIIKRCPHRNIDITDLSKPSTIRHTSKQSYYIVCNCFSTGRYPYPVIVVKTTQGPLIECVWDMPTNFIHAYFAIRVSVGFFIPFTIMLCCYVMIIAKIRQRVVINPRTNTVSSQKITATIIYVMTLFVVCWLPNHIVTLLTAITTDDEAKRQLYQVQTANLVSVCLAYANSALNPILYAFMKEDIRQEGKKMICFNFSCFRCQRAKGFKRARHSISRIRGMRLSFWRSTTATVLTTTSMRYSPERTKPCDISPNLEREQDRRSSPTCSSEPGTNNQDHANLVVKLQSEA